MQIKDNKLFENRIQNFLDNVDMCEFDDEIVDIYLYDFIAFILSNNKNNVFNKDLESLIVELIKDCNFSNEFSIKASNLKSIYNFIIKKNSGVSLEFENLLKNMYVLNDKRIDINYKLNYDYYKDKIEKDMLQQDLKYCDTEIIRCIDLINSKSNSNKFNKINIENTRWNFDDSIKIQNNLNEDIIEKNRSR